MCNDWIKMAIRFVKGWWVLLQWIMKYQVFHLKRFKELIQIPMFIEFTWHSIGSWNVCDANPFNEFVQDVRTVERGKFWTEHYLEFKKVYDRLDMRRGNIISSLRLRRPYRMTPKRIQLYSKLKFPFIKQNYSIINNRLPVPFLNV